MFHPMEVLVIDDPASPNSIPDYYASSFANNGGVVTTVDVPAARARSESNATLDNIDIRKGMPHSLTDLYEGFSVDDPGDVCSFECSR